LLPSDVRALAPDGIERGGLAFRRGRNGATESLEERDMKKIFGFAAVAVLGTVGMAQAQTSSGTLTITGTIESSINLTIESAGGTTSGTGTAAATSALGNVSKYGSAPTGFTLARGASDWTLSSTVGVKVDKANLTSTDYTLTAQLGSGLRPGLEAERQHAVRQRGHHAHLDRDLRLHRFLLVGHRGRGLRGRRRDRQRDQLHGDLQLTDERIAAGSEG
jgi:hypothetical protein